MRVRGLKHEISAEIRSDILSHPMRVRGLKHGLYLIPKGNDESHPMRVRGLKLVCKKKKGGINAVAPHAGAWIETMQVSCRWLTKTTSHPMRVRGLKPVYPEGLVAFSGRTPCGCVD